MRLITAHRILIGAAVAFFLFYAVRTLWAYYAGGAGTPALVESIVGIVVAVGLVGYYRTLRRWRGP